MHVEHFMTKDPVACAAHEPVEGVARLMRENRVGCVIVLENEQVVGLVTDRQLTTSVLADGLPADTPVSDVMTKDPACVTRDDTLFSVLDTMRSAGVVRRLPVVTSDNKLLGVVSMSDIAVIATDLIDALLLEETHHSMTQTRVLTGAKRIVKVIRRPSKADLLPPEEPARPVTHVMTGMPERGAKK